MTAHKNLVNKLKSGFTLIELLIVMAILGVLAVVVLVAINPAEQMRRARDAGKTSGVQQIGRAVAASFTAVGLLPAEASWSVDLVTAQELTAFPAGIDNDGNTSCTGGDVVNNTWCYKAEGDGGTAGEDQYVVYAQLFSEQREQQCVADGQTGPVFMMFSSTASRGGLFCGAEPAFGDSPEI